MTDPKDVGKAVEVHVEATEDQKKKTLQEVQTALEKSNKDGRNSLYSYVLLGKALISARNILKKEFYTVIHDGILHKKSCQRAINCVIASSSKKDFVDGKNKDLEIDEKVAKLTEKSFDQLLNPSVAKLTKIKNYEQKEWDDVFLGDDTHYNTVNTPPVYTAPKGAEDMTEDEYKEYKKEGTKKVIGKLYTAEKKLTDLGQKLKEAESTNRQNGYDSEAKEKQILRKDSEIAGLKDRIKGLEVELSEMKQQEEETTL